MGSDEFTWQIPDSGTWTLDRTHFPKPLCRFSQVDRSRWFAGMGRGLERVGIGVGGRESRIVNGWDYSRRPVVSSEAVAAREPAARATLERRPWRQLAEQWYASEREPLYDACRRLQAVDPAMLDDDALAGHLRAAFDLNLRAADAHFEHIALFAAVGEFILACEAWGIPGSDAVALLQGASPASAATTAHIAAIAAPLQARGIKPQTLDDVRSAGPDAAAALDSYLAEYGWRLVSGFDACDLCLNELPGALVTSIVACMDGTEAVDEPAEDLARDLEADLSPADRPRFRTLLDQARMAYGVRDDDVGASMWARGLTRRALLEVGDRLAAADRLRDAGDVFDVTLAELDGLLHGATDPSADEIRSRVDLRSRQAAAKPPPFIGPPPTPPDLSSMPPAVREVTSHFLAYIRLMFVARGEAMKGFGIGTSPYRGTARVVDRAEDALARLEPGDVLVTTMTTPAFNTVLPLAGALVVEEGGLLSHAGIMARELGIPAVIGVVDVMQVIEDGATIDVDPVAGTVAIVEPVTGGVAT